MSRAGWWLCSAGPSSPLLSAETQSSTWVSPPPTAGRAAPLSGSSLAPQARMPKSWLPLPATLPTASASLPPRPAASAVVGVPGSAPPRTASPLLRAGECASATSGAASAPGAQTSASPNRAPPATSIPARSDACASLVPTASSWTWTATIPGSMESAKLGKGPRRGTGFVPQRARVSVIYAVRLLESEPYTKAAHTTPELRRLQPRGPLPFVALCGGTLASRLREVGDLCG